MKTRWKAPLYEALVHHIENEPESFHVPGHRNGEKYKQISTYLESNHYIHALSIVSQMDVTELSNTDDLHHPQGAIFEAQKLAAEHFGAEQTYFLVGGSTSGNLSLILALCEPGDYLIIQRNVHKSIINGCRLAGVNVVFLSPSVEPETGLAIIPSLDIVTEALQKYPQAKGVLLTNPNYYGLSIPLNDYIAQCHSFQIPLIIDEAHGAHYGMDDRLPQSAVHMGADAVVQSTHKTLPALTMGAMLHIQGDLIPRRRLEQILAMIQSSSPSYLIMASLDIARAAMATQGCKWIKQTLNTVQTLRNWVQSYLLHIEIKVLSKDSQFKQDPFRILLYDSSGQLSGFDLQKQLEEYQCWAEMATLKYCVLIIHLGVEETSLNKIYYALKHIDEQIQKNLHQNNAIYSSVMNITNIEPTKYDIQDYISEPVLFNKFSRDHNIEKINIEDAEGRSSAEMIVPYPPGIPVFYEGETITKQLIDELLKLKAAGAKFQGSDDQNMISVFCK